MKTIRSLRSALAVAALISTLMTGAAFAQAAADDHIATSKGDFVIHPVHHASLSFTWGGKTIVVDPAPYPPTPDANPTAGFEGVKPDVIFITHVHPDHFNVPALTALAGPNTVIVVPQNVADALPPELKAKAKVLHNGEKATVATIPVEAVAMYNTSPGRLMFHPKGVGNGYVLDLGGKRVYFAGDTEETPELKALSNIDVAFIPMNIPYTMTVDAAVQWVKDFKPKIVYPYHYGQSDVKQFASAVGTGGGTEVRLRKWY